MTEIDIMRDLDYCSRTECSQCSRVGTNAGCCEALMTDAARVMKMQYDAMKAVSEESKKILDENIQLRKLAKVNCTQKDVVECVNHIIHEIWEDDDDVASIITACGKLLEKIGARGYVGVHPKSFRPEIRLEK